MRENAVSRLSAKYTKVTLNKRNISRLFVKMTNRRDIRHSVVNKLFRILEKGEHFETPLMTNKKNGSNRLLDGNHRIEAIEKYLNRYPNRKVEVCIFYYDNLNENQEREIYTKWNLGTKQNTNDFVKQYWDKIPITKMMKVQNGFPYPVSHVWTSKAIEFKTLVNCYLDKDNPIFNGGFRGTSTAFIEKSQKLGRADFTVLSAFLYEYIEIFGLPSKKNAHYKKSVFHAIMRLWLDNHATVGVQPMRNALIRLRGHERVIYYQSIGSAREFTQQCRVDLLNVINGNRKLNLFV